MPVVKLGREAYRKLQQLKEWLGLPRSDSKALEAIINTLWVKYAYTPVRGPK